MNYYELKQISLNNLIYTKANLEELELENKDIYLFLKNWFDNNETIAIKTSGSTGTPKTIQVEKNKMIASAKSTCSYLSLDSNKTGLLCLPPTYIGGMMMLVRAMVANFNLITVEPSKTPLGNTNSTINFTAMTPYQMEHSLESDENKISSIDTIILGGAPISSSLKEKIKALPNVVYETFGMTETLSHIALKEIKHSDYFQVLAPTTISVNKNQCLVIDAPHLGISSLNTNDVVELQSPTSFKWLGRKDFVVNSGGIKIHPEQLEEQISEITGLSEDYFLITSIYSETLGEQVILFYKKEFDKEKLSQLPKYHRPKESHFLSDFEYTANGKINRIKTKEKGLKYISKIN